MSVLQLGGGNGDRPEVDVFGKKYRIKSMTRSVEKAFAKAGSAMTALSGDEDADGDTVVPIIADAIAALLVPVGKAPPARDVIMEQWEADELSLVALSHFSEKLQEQAVEADRPT